MYTMAQAFTPGPVHLAYDGLGSGEPALVVAPGWVSHLALDWATPEIRDYYERLAQRRRVVRYDKRGTGLSDRPAGAEAYHLDVQVEDLRQVMDAAGLRRAALLGWSEGGPIALAFAAQYPDRVSHLVLYATAAEWVSGSDARLAARRQALTTLVRSDWGLGSRVFADIFLPERDEAHLHWFAEYQRAVMSPGVAADFLQAIYQVDIRPLLPRILTPALVLHRRHDNLIAFERGQQLAAALPHARFLCLEGEYHAPYFGDSVALTRAIDDFLKPEPAEVGSREPLSDRETEILGLLAEGLHNREIADRLGISHATVARHAANIFVKLGVSTRAAAAAVAFRRGLVY